MTIIIFDFDFVRDYPFESWIVFERK